MKNRLDFNIFRKSNVLDRLFIITIIILCFHFFISFLIDYTNITYTATRVIIVASLILYLVINTFFYKYEIKFSKKTLPLLALLIFFLMQGLFSPYIKEFSFTLEQQYVFSLYLILFLFIALMELNISEYTKGYMIKRLIILVLIINLLTVLFFAPSLLEGSFSLDIIKKYFSNIRFYNQVTTISLPILYLGFYLSKNISSKFMYSFLITFNTYFLLYTGGRGSIIALVASLALIYFIFSFKGKGKGKLVYILLFTILSLGIFYILNNENNLSHSNHLISMGSSGRAEIYYMLISYIFEVKYFLFGLGFFSTAVLDYNLLHPHNLFLFVFLGGGTISLLFFLFILFNFFKTIIYKLKKNNNE